jgi:hypothetical protein
MRAMRWRWTRRFMSDEGVVNEAEREGRVPDATADEVGTPDPTVGFDGQPIESEPSNGYGTGNVGGPGWAGWGA